jgi:hypothetical protein
LHVQIDPELACTQSFGSWSAPLLYARGQVDKLQSGDTAGRLTCLCLFLWQFVADTHCMRAQRLPIPPEENGANGSGLAQPAARRRAVVDSMCSGGLTRNAGNRFE